MTSKEWKEHKIGTICEVLSSKRIFAADYVETGIPFYRSKEIIQKSLGENIEEKLYISKEKFLDIKTKFGAPQKLDLLLSAVGERSGIPYLVNDDEEFYFKDGNLIWFRNFNSSLINSNYLYYWLKSYTGQNSLQNLMIGSAQKALTIIGIKGLSIKLPPLETQEKIARVLSSLDDKIELNNKINQNLEQQAQAIFKSWFVDFEPFGGKMPEDWEKSNLLEIANYLNGLAMQKYRPKDNEPYMPVLKIKELRQGFCDNTSDICTENINDAYIINNGDIIFSWSGSLLVDIWCGGKCGLNQHLFKITSEKYDKWFYYLWTKHYLSKFIALASDMATTMGHIKREELEKSEVIIPNKEKYQKINSIISPILNLIINNKIQNKQLIQLHDTLLPKLMSGEIDVDKVEV